VLRCRVAAHDCCVVTAAGDAVVADPLELDPAELDPTELDPLAAASRFAEAVALAVPWFTDPETFVATACRRQRRVLPGRHARGDDSERADERACRDYGNGLAQPSRPPPAGRLPFGRDCDALFPRGLALLGLDGGIAHGVRIGCGDMDQVHVS